jgi:hypothetical protein
MFPPDPSMGGPNGGSGAYAIRALPGLCFGIPPAANIVWAGYPSAATNICAGF